jgi:hypothetical protein
MAVIHAKVSGKADGGDATLVQPTDWNASHSIGDIIPAAANTYDLGSAASAFDIAYVRNVTFPATQSPSADANTLDDYEEGPSNTAWTPALTCTTPGTLSVAYTTLNADYIKIGSIIKFRFVIITSSLTLGTATGSLLVSGLPFVIGKTEPVSGFVSGYTKAGYTQVDPVMQGGQSYMYFNATGSGVARADLQITEIAHPVEIRGGGVYQVAY